MDRKWKNTLFFQCATYMFISVYLLRAHYMPGIVQGTEYIVMNKTGLFPVLIRLNLEKKSSPPPKKK